MTDPAPPALGLSVGATTLTAVTADRTLSRRSVIMLPALVLTDFVDRVGDPVGIVAPDGSVHPAEALLAEALRGLAYAATAGRALPTTAITHPAHWRSGAIEALRRALRRIPEWAADVPLMIADAAAAATALQADPGLPTRGVIALSDFGGSGTSITLLDAAGGYRPIAPTVRHLDFSGDLTDQGLLAHVMTELSAGGPLDVTGTSAIGSLTRLRAECRAAKERLSTVTVTAVPADLPGFRGDVRLTRAELDDTVRRSLAELIAVLQDTLARAGVRPAELAAVATIGGGAAITVITTTLSEHLRVPVVTTTRSAATAAIGAALRASRGPADDCATAMAVVPVPVDPGSARATGRALAWSQAADVPDLAPPVREPAPVVRARPKVAFEPEPAQPADAGMAWYRQPLAVVGAALLVIFAAGAGTFVALRADSNAAEPASPAPSITTTPQAVPTVEAAPPPPGPSERPAEPPPMPVVTQVVQAPRTVVQEPAPVTETTTVVTTEVSTAPPVTETATVAPSPTEQPPLIPTIPPIPRIPVLSQFFPQPQASG
ncbi:MAG TPA: Hsp70 family protein [Mycobacterium sp.]|nr:Hsp70 family protein [Mycobacterium sp.]